MEFDRQSGVFLHVTSLPGPHGIGDLGDGARAFVDFLADARQSLWQFCPLGPTSGAHGNSPYQSLSAFAGNPLLIGLRGLRDAGYLTEGDLEPAPEFDPHSIEYDRVESYKTDRLRAAFDRFETDADDDDRRAFETFRDRASWLDDYALFVSLKREFDGRAWTDWPHDIKTRDPGALDRYRDELADEIRFRAFCQFVFDRQWRDLREYAAERGVRLVGDLPIYVGLDSADVWADPDAFQLDESNDPEVVAGVPPNAGDSGQRWGNPLYDWSHLADEGFDWWMRRLSRLFDLVDVLRIDHFKGFDAYWAIPADAADPAAGEWRPGPREAFFEAVRDEFGDLPFLVEDLGFLDEGMTSLRDEYGLPGMRVPHYADWCREGDMYQPMHFPETCAAYTATHDTDTTVGYHESMADDQRDCMHYNLGVDGSEINWSLVDAVWNSNALIAVTTMQDLLGLGSDARLNTPGTAEGNWRWRVTREGLDADVADRLGGLTDAHVR